MLNDWSARLFTRGCAAAKTVFAAIARSWGPQINRTVNPSWIAISSINEIYISDTGNGRIRKIDPLMGTISTIAGNGETGYGGDMGSALEAQFWSPYGIAVDSAGNVYVADYLNHRVRRINLRKGKTIELVERKKGGWLKPVVGVSVPSAAAIIYLFLSGGEPDLPKPPDFPAR